MEKICKRCNKKPKKWSGVTNVSGYFCKKCWGLENKINVRIKKIEEMIRLLEGGKTLHEVGLQYNISRERVRQLVKRKGYISNVWDKRKRVLHMYECVNCQNKYYERHKKNKLFCSQSCHGEMAHKVKSDNCERLDIDNNRRYFGKKYKCTSIKVDGKWKPVFVHRMIMEKHLGRKLKRHEHVHHKDGNGLNNDISNLEIIKAGNHARKHNTGWTLNLKTIYLGKITVSKDEVNKLLLI